MNRHFLLSITMLLLPTLGIAEESLISSAEFSRKYMNEDSLVAALKFESFNYNEPNMNTQGLLMGVEGRFEHPLSTSLPSTLVFNFEFLTGKANYTGVTWGGQPITSTNQFDIYQLETQYHLNNVSQIGLAGVTPLVGLGLRGTAQDKESEGDYRREYYYLYASAGLEFTWVLKTNSRIKFLGQADYLLNGYNNTHLSDAPGNMPDVTLNFTSGSAYRLSIEYDFPWDYGHEIQVSLNYTVWSLQASQSQALGGDSQVYEPVNQTFLTGLNVGYLF